ncbi:MAG: hypothetical protein M3069_06065 [Chloroflexota bacterium]|nr:hypothetical protein [Chloroflexota bacterium]
MAPPTGIAHVMNGLALPAVVLLVAVIFAGAAALDHRRERGWRAGVDVE